MSMTKQTITVLLGGDVMLGRLVKEAILLHGANYPLGQITPLLHRGDFVLINLECAITNHLSHWPGVPKAFYFGAPPEAARILTDNNIKLVSLANNHILDFDVQGLHDTLRLLKRQDIRFAGAGKDKNEAYRPVSIQINDQIFGMVAFCDHQQDFAADSQSPGIAYLDLHDEEQSIKQFQLSINEMKNEGINWPILSLHWGPNRVHRPSNRFIRLAHAAIDMGYKLLFGHSAHVFHGIEIYRHCPIIYAAGDFVDDYYVDPEFKNDHQLVFELRLTGGKVQEIILHPIFIEYCRVLPANHHQFTFIAERIKKLCREFSIVVEEKEGVLSISL